jgi:deoxyadenosine/deoxycytidine kinase
MIFGIEGLLGAGKTTLIRESISNQIGNTTIGEYDSYVGSEGVGAFPHFPPSGILDADKNIEYFLNIERLRNQELSGILLGLTGEVLSNKLGTQRSNLIEPIILMDRTYLSLLAFPYAGGVLSPLYNQDVYSRGLTKVQEEVAQGHVILPDGIIYLSLPNAEKSIERVKGRGTFNPNSHFARPKFLEGLRAFYESLNSSEMVHVIDATKPLEDVLKDAQHIIEQVKQNRPTDLEKMNLLHEIPKQIYVGDLK